MAKSNAWIFVGIGILLLVVFSQSDLLKKQETFGLGIHYYNNGVEVFPTKFLGFSIVTPPGGSYDQIGFSITGTATDKSYSNVRIVSAYPPVLENSLPSTHSDTISIPSSEIKSLSIRESKTLWTSSLIDPAQFESWSQPVGFIVTVAAKDDYTKQNVAALSSTYLTITTPCISHSTFSCYDNDIYWYSSCGVKEDKKTECGTSGYTGVNYCYDNDVYRDYNTIGCSGSSCTSSISKIKQTECGTSGCSGSACIIKTWCYQETATLATACGGLAGGGYTSDGEWLYGGNAVKDGSWETGDFAGTATQAPFYLGDLDAVMIINYKKPIGALSTSLWRVGDYKSYNIQFNMSIPSSCWNIFPDQVKFLAQSITGGLGKVKWYCFDGITDTNPGGNIEGWKLMKTYPTYPETYYHNIVIEEAMWWDIQT